MHIHFHARGRAKILGHDGLVEDVFVLTTSFTTYITRPVSAGVVKSIGKVVYRNRSQFIAESILYDSNHKEIARANGVFVRSKIPLMDKIGYK